MNNRITCRLAFLCALQSTLLTAQFAPPAGLPGTTAMYKDSAAFVGWASSCHITRGYEDISNPGAGYASVGDSSLALGLAGSNGVVSLGDGGIATVQFASPLMDGPGPDFAVFENSFDGQFLELAFVEVSSDGLHFFRIPATSNTDTATQTASFGNTDATLINNLAGKYKALYGTPFDIADVPNSPLLNKQAVTHVRIIDVVGSIQNQYCSRDQYNHKVNDPWPTAFASGGFDLDAVGVIHWQAVLGVDEVGENSMSVYPNPFSHVLQLSLAQPVTGSISLQSSGGELVYEGSLDGQQATIHTEALPAGLYVLIIKSARAVSRHKVIRY